MKLSVVVPLALLPLAAMSTARADEPLVVGAPQASSSELPPPDPPPPPKMHEVWYGWQTLTADGASVLAIGLAIMSDSPGAQDVFGVVGAGGLALGAPIVHMAHGRWGIGFADLGVRVGSVIVGGLIGGLAGAASASRCPPDADLCLNQADAAGAGLIIGSTLGMIGASTLDAVVFAREKARVTSDAPAWSWSPNVHVVKDGAVAGLGGTF